MRFYKAPHEPWHNSTVACAYTEHRGSLDTTGAPALPHNSAGARAFIERRASQRAAARWRALLQSVVEARAQQARLAFCRAPWQPGHSRRASASAERLASPGAAAARAQQPGANAHFGFWALFGPVWPRRAPRGSRAPSNCMSTQGRGSKQGPVLSSPAPLRPWQGPGRFRKRAAAKALF